MGRDEGGYPAQRPDQGAQPGGRDSGTDREGVLAERPRGLSRRRFLRGVAGGGLALGFGGALAACGSSKPASTASTPTSSTVAGRPRRGGDLVVGFTGGSTADTVVAGNAITYVDFARSEALYSQLTRRSTHIVPELQLAEEFSATDKTLSTWVVRVKSGVEFHNGKTLTADDVIYSIHRTVNPKSPLAAEPEAAPIVLSSIRKLDSRTIAFSTAYPYRSIREALPAGYMPIVPVGYDPAKPVGTGPFRFESFTPGQQSVFTRNPNYFEPPFPYVDSLTVIDLSDSTSAFDAVVGGQVDGYGNVPPTQVREAASYANLASLVAKSGAFTPFTMRVDQPPFNDVRVRQAMRLLVDRQAMISDVYLGYAIEGNDVFSPFDPYRDTSLVRHHDVAQAKFLLKQAGREDLTVELVTADIAGGVVPAAELLVSQAKAAGVTINLRKVTSDEFFGKNYLSWVFAQDFWYGSNYMVQVLEETLPTSIYNETHFDDPTYTDLWKQGQATDDPARLTSISHAMQEIDFTKGGLIIPTFNDNVDIYSTKLHGLATSEVGAPFGDYRFERIWMD